MKQTNRTQKLILDFFREIPDPRTERTKIHPLEIILFIALCTFLVGGDSFYQMEIFARSRKEWLKEVAGMKHVPSHDTFNRVFQAICPDTFGEFLLNITNRIREEISADIVAFDGKTHRGTASEEKSALHMLNAWSVGNQLVLGQLEVGDKTNEITATPKLMDVLDINGCIITADAMNCQKAIAAKTIDGKADYVFAIKGNQQRAYDEIKEYMDDFAERNPCGLETKDSKRGRKETRRYWQSADIDWFEDKPLWQGLQSFGMVESIREIKGKTEINRRYYISSLGIGIEKISQAIRCHWQVENCLHWRLDVIFNEDESRARTKNAARNLGTLRAICVNLIRQIPGNTSLKGKRLQAALNNDYLLMALKI